MQSKIGYAIESSIREYRERRERARELRSMRAWTGGGRIEPARLAIRLYLWATIGLGLKLNEGVKISGGGFSGGAAESLIAMLLARETPYTSRPRAVREAEEEKPYSRPQIQAGLPGVIYSKEAIRKAHERIFSNTK